MKAISAIVATRTLLDSTSSARRPKSRVDDFASTPWKLAQCRINCQTFIVIGRVTRPSWTAHSIVRRKVSLTGVYSSPSSRVASEPS